MQSISYINLGDSVDFRGSELSFRNARLQSRNDASFDNINDNIISRFFFSFKTYLNEINFFVFIMIILFSIGSWLDVSGIWSELPLMVHRLPEGWRLPSILSAISQLALLVPLTISIFKIRFKKNFNYVKLIYIILIMGAVSCLYLAALWSKTNYLADEKRSVFLYFFNFVLSLLDGMATLTFLPFIGEKFSKEYILPSYIGESFSSSIPGILSIIQGVGSVDTSDCDISFKNSSSFNSSLLNMTESFVNANNPRKPLYSVKLYFVFIFILIAMSTAAFSFLNFSKTAKIEHQKKLDKAKGELISEPIESGNDWINGAEEAKTEKIQSYFAAVFLVSFIYYGVLPGVLTYATIPYGIHAFHLSINIGSILSPFAIIFSIFNYEVKGSRIFIEIAIAIFISIYIFIISLLSPCPPFVNNLFGGVIMIIFWVSICCIFMRARCLLAIKVEKHGEKALFKLGFFSIIGQLIGGFITFFLVEILNVFQEKSKCAPVNYCY